MPTRPIEALLQPTSVVIVGASPKQTVGGRILKYALSASFQRAVFPVNPNYDEIQGEKCFASLAALPQRPDCVVVALPAGLVLDVLREAAGIGIHAAILVAEDFADAGTPEGRDRQSDLQRLAGENGMAVTGPCCMGVASLQYSFAHSYISVPKDASPGGVSVVSQSGGLTNTVVELGASRSVGFNYLISSGNEAVLETADYIEFLTSDPATQVIACIMEGAKEGGKLRRALEAATRIKPVVVLKLGRTESGRKATVAHTGTMAGRHEAYAALFHDYGVALVTISGGASALISDLTPSVGINCPPLTSETVQSLQQILGVRRAFNNPIDTVGLARLEAGTNLTQCLNVLAGDEEIDLVGVVLSMKRDAPASHRKMLDQVAVCARSALKPLFVMSVASNSLTQGWRDFSRIAQVPVLEDTQRGLKAVRKLVDYAGFRRKPRRHRKQTEGINLPSFALPANRSVITEYESKKILAQAGISATRENLAATVTDAVEMAGDIGYPVALKVQSPDIPHKSDEGGVHLGAKTSEEVRDAYLRIMENARKHHLSARVDGVLIQQMVPDGLEMILGMQYDEQFGPLIMLGMGGLFVEIFSDVSFPSSGP